MKVVAKIMVFTGVLALPFAAFAATQHTAGRVHEAVRKADVSHVPKPRITKAQAQQIAMRAARGGKIVDSEYEKEKGGWRWSFDIRQNGKIHEIGVDGMTGKVVENSWESLKSEAQEAD